MLLKTLLNIFVVLNIMIPYCHGRSPAVLYSIEDLKALDDLKSSKEVLRHIFDIRPSDRKKVWQRVLNQNIRHFIDSIISSRKYSISDYRLIERITDSRYLDNDEIFLYKRSEYLEAFFEDCFNSKNKENFNCADEINLAVRKSPSIQLYPESQAKLGMVLKKYKPATKLMPFIKKAITRPIGLKICQNPFVISELLLRVEKIVDLAKSKKDYISKTNDIMGPECLDIIVSETKTQLNTFASINLQEKYYRWLKNIEKLNDVENIKIQSLLFLNGLNPGKTLNTVWNTLNDISENYPLRTRVLDELKKLDPIPDAFLKKDKLSKQVFLRHLDKNFPEFIDFYSNTCKSYYQGTMHFPKGNPTINCKEFLKVYKSLKGENNFKVSTLEQSIKF